MGIIGCYLMWTLPQHSNKHQADLSIRLALSVVESVTNHRGDYSTDPAVYIVKMNVAENCRACGAKLNAGTCWWCSRQRQREIRQRVETDRLETSTLDGVEFECFVRDLLRKQGYDPVKNTPRSGDMGADLIAAEGTKRIVIQCKRYRGAVGVSAVQEVLGAQHFYKADEAWVITDSTFTRAARALAKSCGVRLRRLVLRRRPQT